MNAKTAYANSIVYGDWRDYDELSTKLRCQAHMLRPRWDRKDFHRFAFRVCPDGNLDRRKGMHMHTEDEMQRMQASLGPLFEDGAKPGKGGIRHLRTATFSLNKEWL